MAEDAVALLQEAYAAFGRGDIPALVGMMNPAIEWHDPGWRGAAPPVSGRIYLGPRAVERDVLAGLAAAWDGFRAEPEDFLPSGERVVVLGRYRGTAKATGRAVDVPFIHVWTVRDGTLCRLQTATDSALVLHALGAVSAS